MKQFTFYEVGGKVRDEILGLQSKDVDYVAVPDEKLLLTHYSAPDMFAVLENYLKEEGFEIFLVNHFFITGRAVVLNDLYKELIPSKSHHWLTAFGVG